MNPVLTALGVPIQVQAFFNSNELLFNYGGHYEHYDTGFHRIPTTTHLWLAGAEITREVIITSTAMEAIAYLSANLYKYPELHFLTFIAIGNLPHRNQMLWIKSHFPKRKLTLVFGNDLMGRLTDIKVVAGLHKKDVTLELSGSKVNINYNNVLYQFEQEGLSLYAFEKAAGLRSGCRTSKPKEHITFLDQLKNHANQ
jgi:hypothetical protein